MIGRLLLGYGLAASALWFAVRAFGDGFSQAEAFTHELTGMQVVACMFFMACHMLLNREGFVRLCAALSSGVGTGALRSAWGKSLLAKYVPGGIWMLVGRGALLERSGASRRVAVVSGVMEQMLSMLLCTVFAGLAFSLTPGNTLWGLLCAALAAGTIFLMVVKTKRSATPVLVVAVVLYAAAMPFFLMAYAAVIQPKDLSLLASHLFAGTVSGMAAIVVPGGIGVREAVIGMLGSLEGAIAPLAALMLVRVLTIGLEVVFNLIALAKRGSGSV